MFHKFYIRPNVASIALIQTWAMQWTVSCGFYFLNMVDHGQKFAARFSSSKQPFGVQSILVPNTNNNKQK